MAPSKKSKNPPQPPARKYIRILGPKPVEEEEDSEESDLDVPLARVDNDKDAGFQENDIASK
jgi:hypothetical protein